MGQWLLLTKHLQKDAASHRLVEMMSRRRGIALRHAWAIPQG